MPEADVHGARARATARGGPPGAPSHGRRSDDAGGDPLRAARGSFAGAGHLDGSPWHGGARCDLLHLAPLPAPNPKPADS